MKTTANEESVIRAYMNDDHVSDYGYDDPDAGAWVDGFAEDMGMSGETFSGVMGSLVRKGIIDTDGESFCLTTEGIEIAGSLLR